MRQLAAAALMSLSIGASAHAAHAEEGLAGTGESFMRGVVKESDVDLIFGYLREAMSAAFQGREVAAPDALVRRAEAIGEEAKRRGEIAARAALDAIEREIRESVRGSSTRLPGSI